MNIVNKILLISTFFFIFPSLVTADYYRGEGLLVSPNRNNNTILLGQSNNHQHHNKRSHTPNYSQKFYPNHNNRHHNDLNSHSYGYNYKHNSYRNNYSNKHYQRSCHPVSKVTVDSYGYRQIIGGTMCYNHNGQSYIVPSSRHLKY